MDAGEPLANTNKMQKSNSAMDYHPIQEGTLEWFSTGGFMLLRRG